jgi:hypothetical protein
VADQLSRADRQLVIERLEQISDELGQISTWLTGLDQDRAAIELEQAWQAVAAAGWLLQRPARTRPEGWLGDGEAPQPYQA